MPFDLGHFSLVDMLQCGRAVRQAAASSKSMEDAARAVVNYFYEECVTAASEPHRCVLIRFYKTVRYVELDSDRQEFARGLFGSGTPRPDMKCLTLLATIGEEPEWRDPRQSVGHRAVPLPSVQMVEQAPMISQLIKEMGLEIRDVLAPDPTFIHQSAGKTYNVFHVPVAAGSPYIPAQAGFVEKYGVQSVVGFGGLLGDGELFAVIMFSRDPIPVDSAARFRNIALDVKAAIHPFARPAVPLT